MTPILVYQILRERHAKTLPWPRVQFFQMDEFVPRGGCAPGQLRDFLKEALTGPLGMAAHYLDGRESDQALAAHEAAIDQAGGIDLVLHGIGRNAHLRFNEPGSAFDSHARRVRLSATSRCTWIPSAQRPTEGLTLGLRQLTAAARVRVIAQGSGKREAVWRAMAGTIGPACPASSLQAHPDLRVFIDEAASAFEPAPPEASPRGSLDGLPAAAVAPYPAGVLTVCLHGLCGTAVHRGSSKVQCARPARA